MRLFVAIDLDDATRAAVVRAAEQLRRRLTSSSIRWVTPANLHVTLQFIGHVEEQSADRVRDVLSPALGIEPFDARVAGVGAFPPRGGPRVIWCGVEDRTGRLVRVQKEVERRLVAAAGIESETRPYHPHVTLARFRDAGPVSARRVLDETEIGHLGTCRVEQVTLYESRLSPHGPTYHAIAVTRLSDTISAAS